MDPHALAAEFQNMLALGSVTTILASPEWLRPENKKKRLVYCQLFKTKGEDLINRAKYDEARESYLDGVASLVGKSFRIPLPAKGGLRNEVYVNMDVWEKTSLMACCNALARCMVELGKLKKVT